MRPDVVVIGAGPAGLAAALAACAAGASVHVVDANARPGGQYWMQGVRETQQSRAGAETIAQARAAGVVFHQGAEIWGIWPDLSINAQQAGAALTLRPRALVLAGGAVERVLPFPGWTLPGVMTAGAGQRLVKLGGVRPGQKIAVAGSGPFLLAVTATLRQSGIVPKAFIEASVPRLGMAVHLVRHSERWGEALKLGSALRGVKRYFGQAVVAAQGLNRLEAVKIAPLGPDGPDMGRAQDIECDALLTGWGFLPLTDMAALLGCALRYGEAQGGWFVEVEPGTMATSKPNIFAAGEMTGIGGARAARQSGILAGLGAAEALGFSHPRLSAVRKRARVALRRDTHFAQGLMTGFPVPRGLDKLMTGDTLACRCEEVSCGAIRDALAEGAGSAAGVKMWTRAGMGLCQGRVCGFGVARLVDSVSGGGMAAVGSNPPHIPLRPVPLAMVGEALRDAGIGEA